MGVPRAFSDCPDDPDFSLIASIDRPPSIVWDEVWYVGDARSIFSGTGELRPEHPPLAKLFIVAGDYIFNGFKTPEKDSGVQNSAYISGESTNGILIQVHECRQIHRRADDSD